MIKNNRKILKVYSGRSGCMCGCRGFYRVSSDQVERANAERGYKYSAEEISDRSVKMIANSALNDPDVVFEDNYAFVDDGRRNKVVYFAD